jgi:hypothetical protein
MTPHLDSLCVRQTQHGCNAVPRPVANLGADPTVSLFWHLVETQERFLERVSVQYLCKYTPRSFVDAAPSALDTSQKGSITNEEGFLGYKSGVTHRKSTLTIYTFSSPIYPLTSISMSMSNRQSPTSNPSATHTNPEGDLRHVYPFLDQRPSTDNPARSSPESISRAP